LSFITKFTNLQELSLLVFAYFEDFKTLHYVDFSQLQIFKFNGTCLNHELIKFLEIHGRNLKEIHFGSNGVNSLNLIIAKFCPNLKLLYTKFKNNEIETLKVILHSCQQLESIIVWYDDNFYYKIFT